MPVYVDALVDRGWGLGPSSHIIADTVDELHELATRIGLQRRWFQPTSFPHYDVTAAYREAAIRAGAVPVDRAGLVAVMRRVRKVPSGAPRRSPTNT